MKLHGIIPPLVTPLHRDDTVHEEHLRRVTEHMLNAGVHALFVNGSMGGFYLLSDEEQYRAIGIVVDQVAGRVPVPLGTLIWWPLALPAITRIIFLLLTMILVY